ncbi:MAG: NAD(P)-dependent oxidoreductase [Desulfuromonadaceae bacterium]|nr:NAD(P)-dependent oxidoreductase [Desulfuromonadaceae bacterium]
MNILLTGATGYLGSNLLARLVEDGHKVTIIVRKSSSFQRIAPLLDQISIYTIGDSSLYELFRTNKIETVIHCATNYGRGNTDPSELLESNLTMPLQLLHAGCGAGARCFINTDTILDKGVSDYALSKSQFQEWLGRYAQRMVCVNVALEHFYGPHDDASKFVSYIVKQLLDGVESIDLTRGEQKRDFIYIDDIVSAFLLIIDSCASLKSGYIDYEVGTGVTITIRDFVELAKQITGNTHTQLNFGAIPYRKNEPMETIVNTEAIRALGWLHSTSLAEGLSKIVAQEQETKTI